ncbi:MAG TPA: hypothetical protein VE978_05435 [Chitinophagales bacterium]|nr:hypothetical protein [Chitinophagales bacterium]
MKSNQVKQVIPNVIEEVGAWLLAGGFLFSVAWLIGMIITS